MYIYTPDTRKKAEIKDKTKGRKRRACGFMYIGVAVNIRYI